MNDQTPTDPTHPHDCDDCEIGSRREFLRRSALIVGALAAASGMAPEAASALAVRWTTGRRKANADVSYPMPAADGTTIDTKNQVSLVRFSGMVYAFNLSCPHQNTALKWNDDAKEFQCPKHKSHYKPDGEFISGRATRGMDRLAIRVDGANVVVDVDQMFKEDENKAGWDAAAVKAA